MSSKTLSQSPLEVELSKLWLLFHSEKKRVEEGKYSLSVKESANAYLLHFEKEVAAFDPRDLTPASLVAKGKDFVGCMESILVYGSLFSGGKWL